MAVAHRDPVPDGMNDPQRDGHVISVHLHPLGSYLLTVGLTDIIFVVLRPVGQNIAGVVIIYFVAWVIVAGGVLHPRICLSAFDPGREIIFIEFAIKCGGAHPEY